MRVGMGWIGWSPEVTLSATICQIELAYEGKLEMLESCYGSSKDTKAKPRKKTARTPAQMARLLTGIMESQNE